MKNTLILAIVMTSFALSAAGQQPAEVLPAAERSEILARTETITLTPDLSSLSAKERSALQDLLAAGEIFQRLYEQSRHHQALQSRSAVQRWGAGESTAKPNDLMQLYYLNQGPVATTLDNKRVPFIEVDPEVPGKNVYPWGISRAEVDAFLAANPAKRDEILGERTVVRRATAENLASDLNALESHAGIGLLHFELRERLQELAAKPDPKTLYAVPYSVAYAEELTQAYRLLTTAASKMEESDPEFARYLRNRGRDLLSNDYESGDASWVTGNFRRLNAQLGAYETYDDALYGTKAFHSASILLLDSAATGELRRTLGGLQEIENALPYESQRKVREEIPVGIYDVIADFGQARGANTATILPNDFLFSRRYGRTILMRRNIMTNPDIFASSLNGWKTVVEPRFAGHLRPEGNFHRTLWHEIGHYLGVDADKQGRPLDQALEGWADALEEMKSDLVSLFAIHRLHRKGSVPDERLQAVRASGIRRTLQNNRPRPDQPYQTMQLAQFNYFLENGLLSFDIKTGRLGIDYSKYEPVVTSLLAQVLALQHEGDPQKAAQFFQRYGNWTPEIHEVIARKLREAGGPRFRMIRYAVLEE